MPENDLQLQGGLADLARPLDDDDGRQGVGEAPAPSAEAGRALLYELGVLLEETGETTRALAVFLELLADAGEYKDAQARADRLAKVETGG